MEKDLLKIIEHFKVNNQQRKLQEEVFELQEAIFDIQPSGWEMDYHYYDELEKEYKNHIAEEIADCMVILEQFKLHYGISNEEITKIFWEKVNRTLERIESGHYEK